jgi:DNA polymerase IV
LKPLIERLWLHCVSTGVRGKTVTLKVKYADFQQVTRGRRTSETPLPTQNEVEQVSFDLLNVIFPSLKGVRLLGVSLSSLGTAEIMENINCSYCSEFRVFEEIR